MDLWAGRILIIFLNWKSQCYCSTYNNVWVLPPTFNDGVGVHGCFNVPFQFKSNLSCCSTVVAITGGWVALYCTAWCCPQFLLLFLPLVSCALVVGCYTVDRTFRLMVIFEWLMTVLYSVSKCTANLWLQWVTPILSFINALISMNLAKIKGLNYTNTETHLMIECNGRSMS